MAHLGTGLTWHGDGDWRWCDGRAEQCEAPLCEDDGAEGSGTCTPIHTVSAATVAHAPMRRTRSRSVNTSSEPSNNTATLKAVAAALQSASLPTGPLGQRRKREGSPGLMTGDMRKYVPEHQEEGHHSPDVECTGEQRPQYQGTEFSMTDGATCSICQGISDQESILTCQGCSLTAHLECYFTKGSRDANDTITDMEQWCCETCGGFACHIHPRPVEAKQQRVTWTQSLALHSDTPASPGAPEGLL